MPSAVIKKFEYFPESETLRIVYQSGLIYDYLAVPQSVFDEFRGAFAKGIVLNKNIKGKFDFVKIETNSN